MSALLEKISELIGRISKKSISGVPLKVNIPVPNVALLPGYTSVKAINLAKTPDDASEFGEAGNAGKDMHIYYAPVVKVIGFEPEFLSKCNVRLEMVYYKHRNPSNTGVIIAESDYSPDIWRMPWPVNFQTRAKHTPVILGGVELKTERPNCYQVVRNEQTIPVWEYLNGRYVETSVGYRISDNQENADDNIRYSNINCFVPVYYFRKRNTGRHMKNAHGNIMSIKHPYTDTYKSLHVAFRYIVWDPTANRGKGQIFEGPLSQPIKISNLIWPFHIDPVGTAFNSTRGGNITVCKPPIEHWEEEKAKFKCEFA